MARKRFWRRLRPPRRLRLTREGKYFIAITIGIGLAAVNTGNNLLYLLLGWMLSSIIASGILSETTLRKLRVERRAPAQVFANRPFLMEVAIENPKKHFSSYSVEVEDVMADKPLDKRCYFLKVPSGRTQRTSYRHTFSKRGLYEFDGFALATRFPFGLFRKSRRLEQPGKIVVFPEIRPVTLPPPRARNLGAVATNRVGRRGEFFGLREYRDGDDQRSIHWRTSARAGRLLVREFEDEAQRHVTLMLDDALPEQPTGDDRQALERAISVTASLASAYITQSYAVRLVTRQDVVKFAHGPVQLIRILTYLALLQPTHSGRRFAAPPETRGDNVLVVADSQLGIEVPPGTTHVMDAAMQV